jgi:hypothetical protein
MKQKNVDGEVGKEKSAPPANSSCSTRLAWGPAKRLQEKGNREANDYFFFLPFGGPVFGGAFSLPLAF